ncbi:P-loop NTPase fold protein [Paenibacillus sacheonensis]|uniref:KAP NTPase domain-containing protein n=1 Tax=Paenibacillus sacheonensis TaxID=742054 RepID=A0A7X5BZK6_9BACL|nr:P-loop NTPase fold protein [Paenibacillus sacheonensis]MBM7567932.1 hypothetical protein [Paenibacillus sacheonensis]NBC70817.1 hypothetical protein [Paenibacillus sacheonensis]
MDDYMLSLEKWKGSKSELVKFQGNSLSETDSRCKIIDPLLKEILFWNESSIVREPKVESGFIDYVCKSDFNELLIEAKRTTVPFNIPGGVKSLLTSKLEKSAPDLFAAIEQVRAYAKDKGFLYCAVSNGLTIIFLKTYSAVEDKKDAISFNGHEAIETDFPLLFELLSPYRRGIEVLDSRLKSNGDFRMRPQFNKSLNEERYREDTMIPGNDLSQQLRPMIDNYFSDIKDNKELLNKLYCDTTSLSGYSTEIRKYLRDRVPFFGQSIVEELVTDKDSAGPTFKQDYMLQFQSNNEGHVFIIFGNYGAGKSIFLNRFYNSILDDNTRKFLIWLAMDFEHFTVGVDSVQNFMYDKIESLLNRGEYKDLKLTHWDTLISIYEEEIEEKKMGVWNPFLKNEEKLNEKISELLEDKQKNKYAHIKMTIDYLRRIGKAVCIVLDNVDIHPTDVQELICNFGVSQAKSLKTLVIMTMRDETYWDLRTRHPLNAHNNNITTYQIIPPDMKSMIQKRIKLVREMYGQGGRINFDVYQPDKKNLKNIKVEPKDIFDAIENTINFSKTEEMLSKLTSGNMRNALEFFRTLVTSGHINLPKVVTSVATKDKPKLIYPDKVLRSLALSIYEVYSANRSLIANVYSKFNDGFYSHFVLLRILDKLNELKDHKIKPDVGPGYVPIEELFKYLHPIVKDEKSLRTCLSQMLPGYLIDSDIGSRKPGDSNHAERITLVKITPGGEYYLNELCGQFEYLEVILPDIKFEIQTYFDKVATLGRKIGQTKPEDIVTKWKLRFERVEVLLQYLKEQEEKDIQYLKSSSWGKMLPKVMKIYDESKKEIIAWNALSGI